MNRTIPFFDYQNTFANNTDEFVEIFKDVMQRGAFIMQDDLEKFESDLAEYLDVKHAIGIANCTDALEMALKTAGICEGDEVIFPSHTMVATPSAIKYVGAIPVPVDCGEDHLIDPVSIKNVITEKTKAIMPVQLNGRTADMDQISAIAKKHNLLIIEDSAQALGSKFKQQYAGTFGLAGTFSFYPAKILGCMGDGGALVTNDDEIAQKIKLLRDHGRADSGEVVMWGRNSRLDNMQAAFLNYQFKNYDKIINRRRSIAGMYDNRMSDIEEIKLPPPPNGDTDHFDVYQNYEIEAENRDELKQYLSENGIGTLIQWGGKAVHQYEALGFNVKLPKTEKLFSNCLMIPMNMTISDGDVEYISQKIREFYTG